MTNNSKRSLEYGAVASITLCCRAAIEGGAKPEECYDLSDVLLQQLEKRLHRRKYWNFPILLP